MCSWYRNELGTEGKSFRLPSWLRHVHESYWFLRISIPVIWFCPSAHSSTLGLRVQPLGIIARKCFDSCIFHAQLCPWRIVLIHLFCPLFQCLDALSFKWIVKIVGNTVTIYASLVLFRCREQCCHWEGAQCRLSDPWACRGCIGTAWQRH